MYNLIKLNNGLRIVLENIDYVKSVSVGMWIENGSRNENRDNNGISHFIEHMMFKGTENRNAFEIADCIESIGGQINAFTGKEATCYYVKILDSHIDLALDVLSDMIFNSKMLKEDIEKEKGVIIEEINMNEDSPEDVLSDLHSSAIWGEDPVSYPILGTIDTLKSFTREEIVDYMNRYYIPENSVISICGNFDTSKIQDMVEKYFGSWKSDENKKVTTYSNPKTFNSNLFKKKNIEQLHISLGMPGVELGNDLVYPIILANNILGGGASSILFQKLREEKGFCYSIYSYMSSLNNTGVNVVYAGLNPKYAEDAIYLIKEEINNFYKKGISKEKLLKAKEQLKGGYILGIESTSSRMFNNGKSVLFLNRINKPEDIINKIDAINEDSIREAMDIVYSKGILNSAFVGENLDLDKITNIIEKSSYSFKQSKKNFI